MGNRLQGHNYGYTEARKKPFGEKTWQEIWVGTMAQTQSGFSIFITSRSKRK